MIFEKFGFSQLKFFNIFPEYFIGIMSIYILVVLVLLTSNIYGILVQKVASEIIGFILLLSCFLILKDTVQINLFLFEYNYNEPVFFGFNKFLDSSVFSNFTKFSVCFFSFFYFFIISDFLKDYKLTSFEYLLLLLFAVIGLIFLCSTNDFLTTFLSIELISLCSYLLASFRKTSTYSVESGLKYLIVGAISSSFFLLGSSFIYAFTGSISLVDIKFISMGFIKTMVNNGSFFYFFEPDFFSVKILYDYKKQNLLHFYNHLELSNTFNFLIYRYDINIFYNLIVLELLKNGNFLSDKFYKFFMEVGMIFIIFSIFIKLSVAPFHLWSLDVYEGAPTISTFFFSTIAKLSFFVFLSRFCFTFYICYGKFWIFYNTIIGFLSVFFGSFGGLRQKKIKTLLAYSSVSHMGYSLLAFSTFSILGLEMLYFYLFTYILSNICIWYVVLSLKTVRRSYKNKLSKDISDFVLLNKSNPLLAFGFSVAFLSLAGMPPLLGFLAKLGVFLSLLVEQFYFLAILTILCSVVSTFYYIRLIKILYFENQLVGKLYSVESRNILIFCFFIFALIFLFCNPTLFYLLVHKMMLFENILKYCDIEINFDNYSQNVEYDNDNFLLVFECIFLN